jgi:hypothetical protein
MMRLAPCCLTLSCVLTLTMSWLQRVLNDQEHIGSHGA